MPPRYAYVPDADLLTSVAIGEVSATYTYETNRNLKTRVINQRQAWSAVTNAFNLFAYNAKSELTQSRRLLCSDPGLTNHPVQAEYRDYEYDARLRSFLFPVTFDGGINDCLVPILHQVFHGNTPRQKPCAYDCDGECGSKFHFATASQLSE